MKSLKDDLFGGLTVYFSEETETAIVEEAQKRLLAIDPNDNLAYQKMILSFHQQSYWGFPFLTQRPKKSLTQEQKSSKEAFSYLWTAVQATLILKVVIYFFGLRLAQDNTLENWAYFLGFLTFSWGNLFFFAWRKHRRKDWEKDEPKL